MQAEIGSEFLTSNVSRDCVLYEPDTLIAIAALGLASPGEAIRKSVVVKHRRHKRGARVFQKPEQIFPYFAVLSLSVPTDRVKKDVSLFKMWSHQLLDEPFLRWTLHVDEDFLHPYGLPPNKFFSQRSPIL